MRIFVASTLSLLVVGCWTIPPKVGGDDAASSVDAAPPPDLTPRKVTLSGHAFPFNGSPQGRIAGAHITILELPGRTATTAADGAFSFPDLDEGSEVTLVHEHPSFVPIQIGTIRLPASGAERVSFQVVDQPTYDALAAIVGITPDPTRCQMVSTVTRIGRSIYDQGAHGEADVTVTVEPPLPSEHGPIYFNSQVIPDRSLTRTSDDGGVLYTNVPPGDYVWTATKAGVSFRQVKTRCRAGWLVNASPPWGLQAL